jgi:hypothetical protein
VSAELKAVQAKIIADAEKLKAEHAKVAATEAQVDAECAAYGMKQAEQKAVWEKNRAEEQAKVAFARELSSAAMRNLTIDPEVSALLAIEAGSIVSSLKKVEVPEVEDVLHQSVQASRIQLTLTGHNSSVAGIAFSPDGKRIATASGDRTVQVYALTIEELMAIAKTRVSRSLTPEERRKYLHE